MRVFEAKNVSEGIGRRPSDASAGQTCIAWERVFWPVRPLIVFAAEPKALVRGFIDNYFSDGPAAICNAPLSNFSQASEQQFAMRGG